VTVTVNGQSWDLPDGATLADVLDRLGAPPRGVAVALDGAVVPRARWAGTALAAGASVDVVTAVQGG
jgi:sulfur carrier protein